MTLSFAELRARPSFDVQTVAGAIAAGEASVEAIVTGCLEALASATALNAVVALEPDDALAAARRADAAQAAGARIGPLHGVPIALKDMFYRTGKVSGCGSPILADRIATTTSPLVARLEAAGAIIVGRLHMAEFALSPTGHNAHLGRACNPWNLDLITGGSSSGSGAAVGGRLVPAALGSDTGGSLRLPAAFCGATTLKPTQYLLSTDAMMPLSESLDTPGAIARGARDLAMLMTVMDGSGTDYAADLDTGLDGLTICIPRHYYTEGLDAETGDAFAAAGRAFAGLGARLLEVDVPDQSRLSDLAALVWTPEAAAVHFAWLRDRPDDYGPQVRARLLQGLAIPATAYLQARQHRTLALQAMLDGPFAECDLLLTPAARQVTPLAADVDVGAGDTMASVIADLSALTRTISFLGLPALVTPMGYDARGAPMGLQLIGRPRAETLLLRAAARYEGATDWLGRLPPPLP